MNRLDLQFLQSQQEYPSVSIFATTHRMMPERGGDSTRVATLIAEAKKRLAKEFSAAELAPIIKNLDALASEIDYDHMLDGLALFVNRHVKYMYKLPITVENRVVIDSTFVTRDILHALNRMPRYWVLMLSEKSTRLYHGIGNELSEVVEAAQNEHGEDQDGFPYSYLPSDITSEHEKLGDDLHRDAQYLDAHKKKFFERIDDLLSRFTSVEKLPLVLAGTEKNIALFKDVAPDQNVIVCIHGDYSHNASSHEIAKLAWPQIERYLDDECKKKIESFSEAIGRMQHAFGIDAVWRVAREGRVHHLLVEENFAVPGVVNSENEDDLIIYDNPKTPGISDDLVNTLIELVMDKGGSVTFCSADSLKEYDQIAAILRY